MSSINKHASGDSSNLSMSSLYIEGSGLGGIGVPFALASPPEIRKSFINCNTGCFSRARVKVLAHQLDNPKTLISSGRLFINSLIPAISPESVFIHSVSYILNAFRYEGYSAHLSSTTSCISNCESSFLSHIGVNTSRRNLL